MPFNNRRKTELTTPRLLLREYRESDAQSLHRCFSDPEVMRYWSTLPHSSVAHTETWIASTISGRNNGVSDFVIIHRSTNAVVGKIGIWAGDEIGFMVARAHWRKGFVSEALGVLLPYFFGELDMQKITADVDPRNEASLKVLGKFGFVEVGRRDKTFEIAGVWVDSVDLVLEREARMTQRDGDEGKLD